MAEQGGHGLENFAIGWALLLRDAKKVEFNPVRAGMVERPEGYEWSSAAAHLASPGSEKVELIDWEYWKREQAEGWRELLEQGLSGEQERAVRRATYAGAPLGGKESVERIEKQTGRKWQKRGRPKKAAGKAVAVAMPCAPFSEV